MKRFKYILFPAVLLMLLNTSCIKWGLDDLPLLEEADIKSVRFEYRYATTNANGFERMEYKILPTAVTFSGTDINSIITIPAPSGSFTTDVASQVNLTNIVGYFDISLAATVEPVGSAPVLGARGNFSQPSTYKVTAASGKSVNWTLNVSLAK